MHTSMGLRCTSVPDIAAAMRRSGQGPSLALRWHAPQCTYAPQRSTRCACVLLPQFLGSSLCERGALGVPPGRGVQTRVKADAIWRCETGCSASGSNARNCCQQRETLASVKCMQVQGSGTFWLLKVYKSWIGQADISSTASAAQINRCFITSRTRPRRIPQSSKSVHNFLDKFESVLTVEPTKFLRACVPSFRKEPSPLPPLPRHSPPTQRALGSGHLNAAMTHGGTLACPKPKPAPARQPFWRGTAHHGAC